ncbi:hypothetical protein BH09MYX1_BH09MYX1_41540 [soil metagenome]
MSDAAIDRARRAYERGRLRTALVRGTAVSAVLSVLAVTLLGWRALPWLSVAFLAVTLGEWRGSYFGAGARRGFAIGAIGLLLPMSLLRPCCAGKDMMMDGAACCTMPSACGIAGILLGVSVAVLWPIAPLRKQPEIALGTLLGAAGIFAVRCGGMFTGEVVGLVLGLTGGVLASAIARAWLDRRVHAS